MWLKLTTNNVNPFASGNLENIVKAGAISSLGQLRKKVEIDHRHIEHSVTQFFDLFASTALNTAAAPALGQYTPHFAALSTSYARTKDSNAGFFKNSGNLIRDVKALSSDATNVLGKSSYSIVPKFSGAKKGFSLDSTSPLRVRNVGTGKFANPARALKNFRVEVKHTPFAKVKSGFQPETLEATIFKGGYDEIYTKLTNQQPKGKTRHYRGAFHSFMQWWLAEHLPEVLK